MVFAAQSRVSVEKIIIIVRDGIQRQMKDNAISKALQKLAITERLDEGVVEELESEGAGPKVVNELERLREASHNLPPPATKPAFRHEGVPTVAEQRRLVNDAQAIALNYARSLPDFICTEVVRRFDDPRGRWDLRDTLEVKLSYFDQRENYRLLTVNGRPSTRGFEEVGGAVSEGEFGTMLYSIFKPSSRTVFRWDHWTTLRKRPAHVFTFRIAAENSMYRLQFSAGPWSPRTGVIAGQHGAIYIDAETRQILKIVAEADGIPAEFPVRQSSTVLDYDFTSIGDRSFLLPLRAEVRMGTDHLHTRNLVEFHEYRKFTGESTITFQ